MKIETPQILWHNGSDGDGKPAPLYSISFLPSLDAHVHAHAPVVTATSATQGLVESTNAATAAAVATAATAATTIDNSDTEILATAGNCNEIHIWKLKLSACHSSSNSTEEPPSKKTKRSSNGNANANAHASSNANANTKFNTKSKTNTKSKPKPSRPKIFSVDSPGIIHLTTLTRHEQSINAISFSPLGTHLASAGDGGTLIVHTVPHTHRALVHDNMNLNANGSANPNGNTNANANANANANRTTLFWKTLFQSEKDLAIKIVHTGAKDVMDISWSRDEKRFIIGTVDHSVMAFEESIHAESKSGSSSSANKNNMKNIKHVSKWNCVWRNDKEHTHYVQGVSYDPLGVYLASQGSDRSVRVWGRKAPKNLSINNTTSASANASTSTSANGSSGTGSGAGAGTSTGTSNSSSESSTKTTALTTLDKNSTTNLSMTTNTGTNTNTNTNTTTMDPNNTNANAALNAEMERHLRAGKFDVGKAKVLKYRILEESSSSSQSSSSSSEEVTAGKDHDHENDNDNDNDKNISASATTSTATSVAATATAATGTATATATATAGSTSTSNAVVKKRYLFADESTLESFFRRLAWTTDGAFLVTPASLWHGNGNGHGHGHAETKDGPASSSSSSSPPSFATYLFARHQFDRPYKVLHGLEKPSVVIRPNPVLFELPSEAKANAKENLDSLQSSPSSVASSDSRGRDRGRGNKMLRPHHESTLALPYRSLFAVLTADSILIYDTFHSQPLCVARGLHYAGLTDCSWTADGKHLVVCSTDGYISIVSFEDGELGEVYKNNNNTLPTNTSTSTTTSSIDTDAPSSTVAASLAFGTADSSTSTSTSTLQSTVSPGNCKSPGKKARLPLPGAGASPLPPCEPGQSVLVAPPTKKARTMEDTKMNTTMNTMVVRKKSKSKKKRITPTAVQENMKNSDGTDLGSDTGRDEIENRPCDTSEQNGCTVEKEVVGGVTNLSLQQS
eukprot:CAMPEP_0194101434 /NCGR_PEP_ID=MMETSP0150-20130528/2137_1 /TAXON_ID=122233 /ORGANISM="Chaetoceros debilis, Strain MM31A-1" /LENGTH=967 /DNA_ID=CAMNT_0038788045 /DNA_START=209 /DNA_END=3109 /DNA_ORIENTATION=-